MEVLIRDLHRNEPFSNSKGSMVIGSLPSLMYHALSNWLIIEASIDVNWASKGQLQNDKLCI